MTKNKCTYLVVLSESDIQPFSMLVNTIMQLGPPRYHHG